MQTNATCEKQLHGEGNRVAQEQYRCLLTGLPAVGQVKSWTVQKIVFVGGTCGSIHIESINTIMKALGVLASKWDPIQVSIQVARSSEVCNEHFQET
jgi:hypothetical protein